MSAGQKVIFVKGRPTMPPTRPRTGAAAPLYTPGGSLPGGYVIDEIIGEGGSSLVLKAHKPHINPPIYKAIKVIHTRYASGDRHRAADVQKEYYGEAKVSFELGSDPYAISVEDILEMPDGSRALVGPFIRGHTLSALMLHHLRRGWLLPFELTAFTFHRILSVLVHAKERGIAHRDLCPSNIMVQRTGVPLVLDWGAAAEEHDDLIVGKPGYLAPEIIRQTVPMTREAFYKADIFSLAAVVRQMLTGRNDLEYEPPAGTAYDPEQALGFRERLNTERLTPVADRCPDVPEHLSNIVYTCMKEDPAARPDAEDLYDYLGSEYLYTPQIGFGPTAETLKDYLDFCFGDYDPAQPLPDTRLGRSLQKVIASKVRRQAEQPENRGYLLKAIVARAGVSFDLGHVGRTFEDAFGAETVARARTAAVRDAIERACARPGGPTPDDLRARDAEFRRLESADDRTLAAMLADYVKRETGQRGAALDEAVNVRVFEWLPVV